MKETWLNKILAKKHRLFTKNNGRFYEIVYHKGCFYWQDKITLKSLIKNILINHWEVNEVLGITDTRDIIKGKRGYSTINCMGYGHGIIRGIFVKRKMQKQLEIVASTWSRVTSR